MIAVFSPEGEAMFSRLAGERALLIFDFDGTLAPIVEERERAAMRSETRALLREVAGRYACAIVSGRARADVAGRVEGIPFVEIVGDHGAEIEGALEDRQIVARVAAWEATLRKAFVDRAGVEIERKGGSLAVHHRRAKLDAAGVAWLMAVAAALPGARVFGGAAVVNVVPVEARTKGDAVESLAAREGAEVVLYLGDDVTDEDAFRARAVTFSVRVGPSASSAARYFVEDQRSVDDLLWQFLVTRAGALGG